MSGRNGSGSGALVRLGGTDAGGDGGGGALPDGGEYLEGGRTLQQTRTAFCTALTVQKPRRLAEVERRLLEEAALAGDEFFYGWRAGGESIEGPSVKLALALARNWGNCALELLPVQETEDAWIFTASFVDLETGFTMSRQFRQSKRSKVAGKLDDERKDDIRFQIGQSKAVRNVVLNALPSSLVTRALERAKAGVRAHIDRLVQEKGIAAVIDVALRNLAKCGVPEAAVLLRCGVAERRALTEDHLVVLKGDLGALQSGQERPEALFPSLAALPAKSSAEAVRDHLAERLAETRAGTAPTPAPQASQEKKASKATLRRLKEALRHAGLSDGDLADLLAPHKARSADELTEAAAQELIASVVGGGEPAAEDSAGETAADPTASEAAAS